LGIPLEWLGGFTDKNGKAVVSKEEVRKALSGGFEFVSLYIVYVHTYMHTRIWLKGVQGGGPLGPRWWLRVCGSCCCVCMCVCACRMQKYHLTLNSMVVAGERKEHAVPDSGTPAQVPDRLLPLHGFPPQKRRAQRHGLACLETQVCSCTG
jgi:hypothetical protein